MTMGIHESREEDVTGKINQLILAKSVLEEGFVSNGLDSIPFNMDDAGG